MTLYPLKFTPIIKDYLWGGSRLKEVLHKEVSTDTAAESWEVSGVDDNVSIVKEGSLKGKDLRWLIQHFKGDLLGHRVYKKFGNDFPVLVKFIDAERDLSVQLHPNDELAKKRHNSFGKTEMWYIMQAEADARLIIGFNKNLTPEEFKSRLKEGSLMQLLNCEKVVPGDTFYIHTGRVHAIGSGILLAEIQQTSNITYRIFDYNRKDKDGNTRESHTELAMEAIDYSCEDDFRIAYDQDPDRVNQMVDCPYFITNYLHITRPLQMEVSQRDSFHIYICTEGEAVFVTSSGRYPLSMGETLLVPACIGAFEIRGTEAKFLEVHL
ncbi:mannose-6-phosphate isomerase [Robertkochia marina]|uniref:Phosphohexomutase n=1 Tax=Robertkochia marina TaxID=1227945 RepID=A0A4S3LXL6_9FLAO|nr:type I phosphomannose isomerase catalytic subunit [Robertkochia marina]THD65651.1 mannose-6-phosphate isomerase [Robertkochia marina]TRZ46668.1 mannose-6-phosphate isomerase [Robertkochia marina]